MKLIVVVFIVILTNFSCNNDLPEEDSTIEPTYSKIPAPLNVAYNIIAQYAKDTGAYTQGLEIYKGRLYESTGDWKNSSLRISDWKTGKVVQKYMMGSDDIFGEGLTIFNDKIYQLTWLSNIVYVYNVNNLVKPIQTLKWPKEGWGLTNNGKELIISDGTDNLYFADPKDLAIHRTIKVVSHKGTIDSINELEFINGYIYANVYQQNYIIKIDPANGYVVAIIVLENLLKESEKVLGRTDVLNGIAYDSASATLLITGKRWPKIFEIKLN
ncbi:MAG: glutaminyl-peptide cyclotransferase [Ferruginibacter sp.]